MTVMQERLIEVYNTFKDLYGIMHHSWDMTHDTTKYICKWGSTDFGIYEDYYEEYNVWNSLIPVFKQHNIPYYQGIDDFVQTYRQWLERNGELAKLNPRPLNPELIN